MDRTLIYVILAYLLAVNFVSIAVCFYDKSAAKKGRRRIRERTLFLLSAAGGSVGMYAAMKLIRHKTKHKRFMFGIPLIIILQTMIIFYVIYLTNR